MGKKRCAAICKDGERCKRNAIMFSRYCKTHLPKSTKLFISIVAAIGFLGPFFTLCGFMNDSLGIARFLIDLFLPPTITPTVAPTQTPVPKYKFTPVSLLRVTELDSCEEVNLGLKTGDQDLNEIPFVIGWKVTTQCRDRELLTTKISLTSLELHQPTHVYLLLQGGWALQRYQGKKIGRIVLEFSAGPPFTIDLILGENFRDWSPDDIESVKTVTSPNTEMVWKGFSSDPDPSIHGDRGIIDMITIPLQVEYFSSTLQSITIYDDSIEEWSVKDMNPCFHLLGVTVRHGE